MHVHLKTAAGLAQALRMVAERLDKAPELPLSAVWLQVSVQAVRTDSLAPGRPEIDADTRYATVDALADLLGLDPATARGGTYSAYHDALPIATVNIYTGAKEDDPA